MVFKLILIGINLCLFSLFTYYVKYEKKVDKVCNEIIKDYNWKLNRHFNDLKEASKMTKNIGENANKIKPIIEKLLLVKNKEEADSMSIIAEEMIDKLGWGFHLEYENHKELGISIINQFMDKFEIFDGKEYNTKLNIIIKNQIVKSDSVYIDLMPVFANDNFDSILINGAHNTCENPFRYKDSVKFVLFKGKNKWNYNCLYKTKYNEE